MAQYRVGDKVTVPDLGTSGRGDPFPEHAAKFEITDITDEYIDLKVLPESDRWLPHLNMWATPMVDDYTFAEEIDDTNREFRVPIGTRIRRSK